MALLPPIQFSSSCFITIRVRIAIVLEVVRTLLASPALVTDIPSISSSCSEINSRLRVRQSGNHPVGVAVMEITPLSKF